MTGPLSSIIHYIILLLIVHDYRLLSKKNMIIHNYSLLFIVLHDSIHFDSPILRVPPRLTFPLITEAPGTLSTISGRTMAHQAKPGWILDMENSIIAGISWIYNESMADWCEKLMWICHSFHGFHRFGPPCALQLEMGRNAERAQEHPRWDTVNLLCCPHDAAPCGLMNVVHEPKVHLTTISECCNQLTNLPPFIAAATPKNTPLLSQVWYAATRSLHWQSDIPWWSCLHKQCPAV